MKRNGGERGALGGSRCAATSSICCAPIAFHPGFHQSTSCSSFRFWPALTSLFTRLSLSLSTSLWVPSVMLCGRVKDCTIGLNRPFSSAKKRNSKLNFEAYYHYVVCGRELIDRSARRLSAVRIRDMLVFCVSFHRIVIINWGSVHLRN